MPVDPKSVLEEIDVLAKDGKAAHVDCDKECNTGPHTLSPAFLERCRHAVYVLCGDGVWFDAISAATATYPATYYDILEIVDTLEGARDAFQKGLVDSPLTRVAPVAPGPAKEERLHDQVSAVAAAVQASVDVPATTAVLEKPGNGDQAVIHLEAGGPPRRAHRRPAPEGWIYAADAIKKFGIKKSTLHDFKDRKSGGLKADVDWKHDDHSPQILYRVESLEALLRAERRLT